MFLIVLTSSKEDVSVLTEISPSALSTRKPSNHNSHHHHKKTILTTKQSPTQFFPTTTKITKKHANLSEIFSVKPKTNPINGPRNTIAKEKTKQIVTTEKTTTTTTNKPSTTTISTTTSKVTTTKLTTYSTYLGNRNSNISNIKLTHHIASTTEAKLELSSPFSVIDLNGYMTDDMNGAQKVNQPIFVETSTKRIEFSDLTTKKGKIKGLTHF